ncbi:hypothetical protein GCM10023107_77050 [Actinoplanes octamycinicus]|nr:hypothetical protein Aoc01nite_77230 [Actinoplanes octamycinicus]
MPDTSSTGRRHMSSQGDRLVSGPGRAGVRKISRAQIICIQVVPHFDGALITMSPGRSAKPCHRVLSFNPWRYTTGDPLPIE